MKRSHLLLLIFFNAGWAASLTMVQKLFFWLDPSAMVTLRYGVAALMLLPFWRWLGGETPKGMDLLRACVMGLIVFTVGQRLQVLGNRLSSAGNSSVLMGFEPVLTSIAAALFLSEHVPARRWLGCLLGLFGVMLLNGFWRPEFQWTNLTATGIFMLSFLCESIYSILGKPLATRAGPLKVVALGLLTATVFNLAQDGPRIWTIAAKLPAEGWVWLVYLALICTVLGYAVWLVVLRESDVNLVALTILVQPLAGVPVAVFWLGEKPHWGQLWGCLAIASGLLLGFAKGILPGDTKPETKRSA